tara:strand:+ start:1405 stop:1833 length:429 start_codon:yes stop_codon:yes gene_type:complete
MIKYQEILNKNLKKTFIDILKYIEKNGLEGENHLYITFTTNHSLVSIPNWLLKKYPNEMTIVIQYEYFNFTVNKNNFKIGLSFNDVKANLIIGYDAIISFADPYANFGLRLEQKTTNEFKNKINSKKQNSNNVIDFTNYKKN